MHKITWKTTLALSLTLITWSSAYVGIRIGVQVYSPGSVACFRYLIAALTIVPVFIFANKGSKSRLKLRDVAHFLVLGGIGISLYNVALNYGEISIPAAIASFIISQMPVIICLAAVFIFKETLRLVGWLGILVSMLGMVIIAIGEHAGVRFDWGVVYVSISLLCGATYAILQKPLLKRYSPIEVAAYSIWSGALLLALVFLPQLLHELPHGTIKANLAIIYLGVFPATMGYILWSYTLTHMPTTQAGNALYLMPLITTLIGWAVIGEVPALVSLMGGLVGLLGAFITHQAAKAKTKQPKIPADL